MTNATSSDWIEALKTVDTTILGVVARMIAHLRAAPDLRTAAIDPADFGVDEQSPQWEQFMKATGPLDPLDGDESHAGLAQRLAELASAVETVLADRSSST